MIDYTQNVIQKNQMIRSNLSQTLDLLFSLDKPTPQQERKNRNKHYSATNVKTVILAS